MGLDEMVNKAKDLLGAGADKAEEAATAAEAGNTGAAKTAAAESEGLIGKAKEFLSDERIDGIANAIKDKTPDSIDGVVDQVAGKAKVMND